MGSDDEYGRTVSRARSIPNRRILAVLDLTLHRSALTNCGCVCVCVFIFSESFRIVRLAE